MEETMRMRCKALRDEIKKVGGFAVAMAVTTALQYLRQVVGMMMVGHLGQLSLSSVAIAISLTNITGFSLLSGMAGGLETLCGQAYGAEQFQKLGTYTLTAILTLLSMCPPISVLWFFMHKFLSLVGQDPSISAQARTYSLWLIPALFGTAIVKPLTRYLQSQTLILPMMSTSFCVLCLHLPLCWGLVYKLGLGPKGTAIAYSISTWLNVALLAAYAAFSPTCRSTRLSLTKHAFFGLPHFFRLALPSAVMVCVKWWSWELMTLLSGRLPNPKLETSVLSICLTISTLHFTIPLAVGAAASTRVSNELGCGNPEAARMAMCAATFLGMMEAVAVSAAVFCSRRVFGYAFSSDVQVVRYFTLITPLLCVSVFMDGLQAVLSGVSRGCGWQHVGAYVNLGAYYMVGLPIGVVLGFPLHLRAKGLWIGIVIGSILQSALLSLITTLTNWNKQATNARRRILDERLPDDN